MKYTNAELIIPGNLLKEIQKYVQGEMVYIPKHDNKRKGWGVNSGSRAYLTQRNQSIRNQFEQGVSIEYLAESFFLSQDSIKRIVYSKKMQLCKEHL